MAYYNFPTSEELIEQALADLAANRRPPTAVLGDRMTTDELINQINQDVENAKGWQELNQALGKRNENHNPAPPTVYDALRQMNPNAVNRHQVDYPSVLTKPLEASGFFDAANIVDKGSWLERQQQNLINQKIANILAPFKNKDEQIPTSQNTTEELPVPAEPPRQSQLTAPIEIQPQKQVQPVPSQNSATEMQNEATRQALWEAKQKFNPQPVSGVFYPQLQNILFAKEAYEKADNPATQNLLGLSADEIRRRASNSANMYRQMGEYADADLSGYGSEVSLNDAYANLQTERAKAAIDFYRGKYSRDSDTFFNDKFRELVNGGMYVGRARRAAAEFARQYQAERVAYLSQTLYGYGYDGRVMTPLGRQIVAELAREGRPELANIELQKTAGDLDAYNKESALAQAIAQATLSGQNAKDLAALQHLYGFEDRADVLNNLFKELIVRNDLDTSQYDEKQGIDFKYNLLGSENDRLQAKQKAYDTMNMQLEMLMRSGYSEQDAYKMILKQAGFINKNDNKEFITGLQNYVEHLTSYKQDLIENLPEDKESKEYKLLVQEINGVSENIARVENVMNSLFGINGVSGVVEEYNPNDQAKNLETITQIMADGMSKNQEAAQVAQTIHAWSGGALSPDEILAIMKSIMNQNGGDTGNGKTK